MCTTTHTHAHTHAQSPRAITSNLQVELRVQCRRNGLHANNNTAVGAGSPLKNVVKLIIFRIWWRFSKLINLSQQGLGAEFDALLQGTGDATVVTGD